MFAAALLVCGLAAVEGFAPSTSQGAPHSVEVQVIGSVVRRVRGIIRKPVVEAAEPANLGVVVQTAPAATGFDHLDQLHADKEFEALLERLESLVGTEADGAEVRWRIARVHCDLSHRAGSAKERETYVRAGLVAAKDALDLSGGTNGYAHKWYGILLGLSGDFETLKNKISNSHKIKDALDRADAALPDDPTVKLALGQWAFKVAKIGAVGRQLASVLFAKPPSATYEEALSYFEESYRLKPTDRAQDLIRSAKAKIAS
mmetsp:Transcript_17646/g.55221  ORF Transcript_17646/g.55221 Transcript_17646/m.55221 type:complete len:260 (-) Transcript_17646:218-997(-)|eukprot:CAMPEP_0197394820 /NCGR_PEP_ID=MMETSP1165-20131217/6172_1 /TAXON_ID=284809 /ORGANISM="Chrysocystis fragilis, Strain CCMP3189" /LENGTH=259 /DNA_ID=CAMNT_0042920557 /DNA_START=38 /DNA_END=817 /DNA_ORIENTATION=+